MGYLVPAVGAMILDKRVTVDRCFSSQIKSRLERFKMVKGQVDRNA